MDSPQQNCEVLLLHLVDEKNYYLGHAKNNSIKRFDFLTNP